jgi:predicted nucleic acid-binding protein
VTDIERRIVVIDANVLINLIHVDRLGLLAALPGHAFVVPEHVQAEVTRPELRAVLDEAVRDRWLTIEAITDLDAIGLYAELARCLGRGEAACIAIAVLHGWWIASDEKRRFRREAEARVGVERILDTVEIFVLAIRAGLLTIDEADAAKASLEARRFRMPFGSFRERVGGG